MGLMGEEGSSPAAVVRRQYLASAAGDLAALRETLAPDVEWTEMAGFPLAGTYRTPEGVTTNVMEALGREWDGWTAHDDTYVVDGEHVVVIARYTATHRVTGKALACRVAHHFVVRAGLIVRFEQFRGHGPRAGRRVLTEEPAACPAQHPWLFRAARPRTWPAVADGSYQLDQPVRPSRAG